MSSPTIPTKPEFVTGFEAGPAASFNIKGSSYYFLASKHVGHIDMYGWEDLTKVRDYVIHAAQHYTETAAERDNIGKLRDAALSVIERKNVEIDRLISANKAMREALEEIEAFTRDVDDDDPLSHVCGTARAALKDTP